MLSHEAFPRGFPTGLSHVPPRCESILGLKVKAVKGKQVSLEWTETSGVSGNGGTTLEFLSPFLWRVPPLEMRRECRDSFPTTQGKDPSSRAMRRTRGSSGCGQDTRASSREETGMAGNFLSCSKAVQTLWKFHRLGVICLETPQWKWASTRLEGKTSWVFSNCGSFSHLTMGSSGTRSGGLRQGQSPCQLLGGLSGFLSVDARA